MLKIIGNRLKAWFIVNWKTTVLGAVAAVEIYQTTHSLEGALTAFFFGLFSSDGKSSHAAKPTA